ncbi:MAG: Trk system potassium transporter TrkA [Clostridia bacterium]|nr:Trk system potassium transporter TrkA [Clostridia bacterium]
MKIVLVGAGRIGSAIVANLVEEEHNITVIDKSQAAIDEITDSYDIICLNGNGADIDALKEAGAGSCRLFIACTHHDDTNMLACLLAKRLGAEHTIARIRNPENNDDGLSYICRQLDISEAINPESLAATDIFNILKFPSAENIETFSGRFELIELVLHEDSKIVGVSLADLRKNTGASFLITAIQREGITFIPRGGFELHVGDRIALTAAPKEMHKLLKKIGSLRRSAKNVMIIGAGITTLYLTKKLLDSGIGVKVIDPSREKCEEFVTMLNDPAATVICGDCASQSVLLEEGISDADAFVALTNSDEQNILISIFAMNLGVKKAVARVDRKELVQIAEKIGLDAIVSPNSSATNQIATYARALKNSEGSGIEALYKVLDETAEAIEFRVDKELPFIGVPLKEMKLKKNILIAGIIREGVPLIPVGTDSILFGDRVVVLSSGHKLGDLRDIAEE